MRWEEHEEVVFVNLPWPAGAGGFQGSLRSFYSRAPNSSREHDGGMHADKSDPWWDWTERDEAQQLFLLLIFLSLWHL